MDTSKEYILMCEKSIEIQYLWVPGYGDMMSETFSHRLGNCKVVLYTSMQYRTQKNRYSGMDDRKASFIYEFKTEYDWLPRQDQLQEMIKDFDCYSFWIQGEKNFDKSLFSIRWSKYKPAQFDEVMLNCESMEQLWLAFVMKEKFSKQWNGSDWVTLQEREDKDG